MTQTGTVTRILGNGRAEVAVQRQSACGAGCESCAGTCSFKGVITAVAENNVLAGVGDSVVIRSASSRIIGLAALVYLVPLATMLLGYLITSLMELREPVCALVSLACLAAGLAAAVVHNKSMSGKDSVKIEIVEILT